MKKTILLVFISLFISSFSFAQSAERFIRIIGNAKKEISAQKTKVQFSISEQKSRSISQQEEISFEDAYAAAIAALSKVGIEEDELRVVVESNSYARMTTKNYAVITDLDKLEGLSTINLSTFRIKNISYIYDAPDQALETELSLKAINDAKRKAKAICDDINMKVGKILNIEVKETGFGTDPREKKKESNVHGYRVAVTFKLID